MNKKTMFLMAAVVLAITLQASATMDVSEEALDVPVDSYMTVDYQIRLGEGHTATIQVNDDDGLQIAFSQTQYTHDADGQLFFGVGPESNHTIKLSYIEHDENHTKVNCRNISLDVNVYLPLEKCYSNAIKENTILQIGQMNLSLIQAKAEEATLNISGPTTIVKRKCKEIAYPGTELKTCLTDSFPAFNMAKLTVFAATCPRIQEVEDKQKEEETSKPQSKKVIIKKLTKTYERGKNFVFRTVDNNTEKPLGQVFVEFGSREGYVDSVTTEKSPSAIGSIKIPEDFNSSTFYITIAGGLPEGYNSSFEVLNLRPWEEYQTENTLTLANLEHKEDKKIITAKTTNLNGRPVPESKLIVEYNEKRTELNPGEDGRIEFPANKSGVYELKAMNTELESSRFDSEWFEINVSIDSDGDGVIDSKDECKHEEGVKENTGCPLKEAHIITLDKVDTFTPGEEYEMALRGENDTPLHASVYINGEETNTKDGEFTFKPDKEREYMIVFNGSKRYEATHLTIDASSNSMVPELDINTLAILLLVVGIVLVAYTYFLGDEKPSHAKISGSKLGEGSTYKPPNTREIE